MARRARAPPGPPFQTVWNELDALEVIAEQLEKLRMLKEYELGVRIEDAGGSLNVKAVEKK
jgi:hypothetical protein